MLFRCSSRKGDEGQQCRVDISLCVRWGRVLWAHGHWGGHWAYIHCRIRISMKKCQERPTAACFRAYPLGLFLSATWEFLHSILYDLCHVSYFWWKRRAGVKRAQVTEPVPWGHLVVIRGIGVTFKRYLNLSFPESAYYTVHLQMP